MRDHFPEILILFLLLLITFNIISFCQAAAAQSEEQIKILLMFYKEEDLVVTPTRRPEPLSQVAENITVITSEEIEMIAGRQGISMESSSVSLLKHTNQINE